MPIKIIEDNKLFNMSVSSDGRFLVTEGYDYSTRVFRTIIRVYDLQENANVVFEDYGVSEGTIVKNENRYYVVYFKYDGEKGPHNGSIVIAPLKVAGTTTEDTAFSQSLQPVQLPLGFGNNVVNDSFAMMERVDNKHRSV